MRDVAEIHLFKELRSVVSAAGEHLKRDAYDKKIFELFSVRFGISLDELIEVVGIVVLDHLRRYLDKSSLKVCGIRHFSEAVFKRGYDIISVSLVELPQTDFVAVETVGV
ncbi:MAG: hypothetical protein IJK58_01925 [Clostridia bacterium]|nr:hypothetical protein [Clostridia bacterium]